MKNKLKLKQVNVNSFLTEITKKCQQTLEGRQDAITIGDPCPNPLDTKFITCPNTLECRQDAITIGDPCPNPLDKTKKNECWTKFITC